MKPLPKFRTTDFSLATVTPSVIATHRRSKMYDHASTVAKVEEQARAHTPPEQLRDPVAKLRVAHRDKSNALGAKHRRESLELRNKLDAARAKDRALSNSAIVTHEWLAKEAADRRKRGTRAC